MTSKQLEKIIKKVRYSYTVLKDGDFRVEYEGYPAYVVLNEDDHNLVSIFVQGDINITKETSFFRVFEILANAQIGHKCAQCILLDVTEGEDAQNIIFRVRVEADNDPEFFAKNLSRYFSIVFNTSDFIFGELEKYRVA